LKVSLTAFYGNAVSNLFWVALLSHLPIEKLPKIGNKIGKEKLEEIKRLELVNCIDLQVRNVIAC
jgi:hypothetical protein